MPLRRRTAGFVRLVVTRQIGEQAPFRHDKEGHPSILVSSLKCVGGNTGMDMKDQTRHRVAEERMTLIAPLLSAKPGQNSVRLI